MLQTQAELLTQALTEGDVATIAETTTALGTMVSRVDELNRKEIELQAFLAEIQGEKRKILEEVIPSIMLSQNITEIKLADGRKLSYKEEYYTHVKDADKPLAWEWFRHHGLADIVKNKFEGLYTAGQTEEADRCKEVLADAGIPYTCKEDVHPSTLKSVVNKLIAAGNMPPQDLFGIYQKKSAVVKK